MTYRILMIGKNSTMPRLTGPTYDATNERWITPPSGMNPDAGAAADLRQHSEKSHTLLLETTLAPGPVDVPSQSTGRTGGRA